MNEEKPKKKRTKKALGFKSVRSHGQRGYNVVAYTDVERKANRSMLAYDARLESETSTVTASEILNTNDTLF